MFGQNEKVILKTIGRIFACRFTEKSFTFIVRRRSTSWLSLWFCPCLWLCLVWLLSGRFESDWKCRNLIEMRDFVDSTRRKTASFFLIEWSKRNEENKFNRFPFSKKNICFSNRKEEKKRKSDFALIVDELCLFSVRSIKFSSRFDWRVEVNGRQRSRLDETWKWQFECLTSLWLGRERSKQKNLNVFQSKEKIVLRHLISIENANLGSDNEKRRHFSRRQSVRSTTVRPRRKGSHFVHRHRTLSDNFEEVFFSLLCSSRFSAREHDCRFVAGSTRVSFDQLNSENDRSNSFE